MIKAEDIERLLGPYKSRTLDYAQMALPDSQFQAFRKCFLDAFGKSGFLSDLDRFIADASHSPERPGSGRNIPRKKGGVPWVKATSYEFSIESKSDFNDDPSKSELQYIIPFLPEIMAEMVQIMSKDED